MTQLDHFQLAGLGSNLHLLRLRSFAGILPHLAPPQDLQLPAGPEGRYVAVGDGGDDGDDAAGRTAAQRVDVDDDHQDDAEEPDGVAVRHLLPRFLPHLVHPLRHDLHVRGLRLSMPRSLRPKLPKPARADPSPRSA